MGIVSLSRPDLSRLSRRERRILLFGAIIAAGLFVLAVVLPLERSVAALHRSVAHRRSELAWMRRVAPELAAAGPPGANGTLPLIVLIDQSARRAGLSAALTGSAPEGPDILQVRLQRAPFDTLIAWLARLEQRDGVVVRAARIQAAKGAGLVDAALTLKRS
ncbi:MAG: type II secretion system protein GspM [Steroidobacteraceae bacterium]